jgi:hypothetical protein
MKPPAVFGVFLAAVALISPATAATAPKSWACPPASIVNSTLGVHQGAPTITMTPFSKTCTYPGPTRLSSISITFQKDNASQFATDEKATVKLLGAAVQNVKVRGDSAWTTGAGDLYIFDGKEQIKIHALSVGVTSPKTATAKVEALADKLL